MKKSIFYIAALLPFSTAMFSAAPATPSNALLVEVLIYSGRPNPTFTITDPSEIQEITARVNALPDSPAAAGPDNAETPVLGYQGIVVLNTAPTSPGIESFVVKHSRVHLKQKSSHQANVAQPQIATAAAIAPSDLRVDGAGALETRLLGLARAQGAISDGLLNHIKNAK